MWNGSVFCLLFKQKNSDDYNWWYKLNFWMQKKNLKKCEQEEAFSKDLILSPINFLNDLT